MCPIFLYGTPAGPKWCYCSVAHIIYIGSLKLGISMDNHGISMGFFIPVIQPPLPSDVNVTKNYGKSPFFIGKSTISTGPGPFSIVILTYPEGNIDQNKPPRVTWAWSGRRVKLCPLCCPPERCWVSWYHPTKRNRSAWNRPGVIKHVKVQAYYTNWWFFATPLKNMTSSVGVIIPNIYI